MKLGFVSLLSKKNGVFGGGFSFPSFPKSVENSQLSKNISLGPIKSGALTIWFTLLGIISLAYTFITSVFTFSFMDALLKKNFLIKESWNENKPLGASFFWFRILIGLIGLLVSILILLPLFLQLFNHGFDNILENFMNILPSLILPIVFLSLFGIIFGIFLFFVHNFSLVDMKINKIRITQAIKNTFKQIKLQKKESAMYLLAVFVLGIGLGILSFVIGSMLVIVTIIIGLILFFTANMISFILVLILLIPLTILFIYVLAVVLMPIKAFLRYFSILGYEKLYNKKILR